MNFTPNAPLRGLTLAALLFASTMLTSSAPARADDEPRPTVVGGSMMYPSKDIVDNAINSADHTTLVAAVKAAGLVDTLKGDGPFTVFAPTNVAFAALPSGTVDALLRPDNKQMLSNLLTYHVVAGELDFDALAHLVDGAEGGKAVLTTVAGGKLNVLMNGPHNLVVVDEKGNTAHISTYDVRQRNGVIHVIDRVLMPQ